MFEKLRKNFQASCKITEPVFFEVFTKISVFRRNASPTIFIPPVAVLVMNLVGAQINKAVTPLNKQADEVL